MSLGRRGCSLVRDAFLLVPAVEFRSVFRSQGGRGCIGSAALDSTSTRQMMSLERRRCSRLVQDALLLVPAVEFRNVFRSQGGRGTTCFAALGFRAVGLGASF